MGSDVLLGSGGIGPMQLCLVEIGLLRVIFCLICVRAAGAKSIHHQRHELNGYEDMSRSDSVMTDVFREFRNVNKETTFKGGDARKRLRLVTPMMTRLCPSLTRLCQIRPEAVSLPLVCFKNLKDWHSVQAVCRRIQGCAIS
jgi:hypothetical protein